MLSGLAKAAEQHRLSGNTAAPETPLPQWERGKRRTKPLPEAYIGSLVTVTWLGLLHEDPETKSKYVTYSDGDIHDVSTQDEQKNEGFVAYQKELGIPEHRIHYMRKFVYRLSSYSAGRFVGVTSDNALDNMFIPLSAARAGRLDMLEF